MTILKKEDKNSMFLNPNSEDEVIGIARAFEHKTSTYSDDISMSVINKIIEPIKLLTLQQFV